MKSPLRFILVWFALLALCALGVMVWLLWSITTI